MKRLWLKIFFMLMTANVALLLLLYWGSHWSFEQAFSTYLDDQTEERFAPLKEALVKEYQSRGDWEWVIDDHRVWRDLMKRFIVRKGEVAPEFSRRLESPSDAPKGPPFQQSGARPNPRPVPGSIREGVETTSGMNPHILLYDAGGKIVIGNPNSTEKVYLMPIELDGETIGTIGVRAQSNFLAAMEHVMAGQNNKRLIVIILALMILSLVVAFFLATWATFRVLRIKEGTTALVRGNYDYRIPVNGKDTIEELASDFNRLAEALAENRSAHQRWIASTSHELRTPVTILQGEIDALKDGIRTASMDYLDGLSADVSRLNLLIDDLHQLSMSDLGALNYQKDEIDFTEFMDDEMSKVRGFLPSRLDLSWHNAEQGSLTVLGDTARLSQVIRNLSQNTIRYTDLPGELSVSLTSSTDNVLLAWEDSAPGVDESDLEKLTEPLYRTEHSRSRKQGGSGLGLAITQAIVHAHGGTMKVSMSKLGGLKWEIRLPKLIQ